MKREAIHHTQKSLPWPGHPPAMDERTQWAILQNAKSHCFKPYKNIAEHVDGVTSCQVQHVLHHAGYCH
jgi:hypothetical protein